MEELPLSQEGRIVLMFDCDLDDTAIDTYAKFVPANSKRRTAFMPNAFADAFEISRLEATNELHDYDGSVKLRQQELWEELPIELKRILEDSRIQLSILINSNGGAALTAREFWRMIGWFRNVKCPIDCYVTDVARSVAASIMKWAPMRNRHLLHTTEVLLHESRSEKMGTETPHMQKVNDKERDRAVNFLRRYAGRAPADVQRRIEEVIERASVVDDCEMRFTGADLKEFGIVEHLHKDRASMLSAFQSALPIKLGDKNEDPVAKFFTKPKLVY